MDEKKRTIEESLKLVPESMAYYLKVRGFSHELIEAAVKCWTTNRRWVSPAGHCWGEEKAAAPLAKTLEKPKAVTA